LYFPRKTSTLSLGTIAKAATQYRMPFHVHPYQQNKMDFSSVLLRITNPCKHHGLHPEIGFLTEGYILAGVEFISLLKGETS
jgi:hypothetical protein